VQREFADRGVEVVAVNIVPQATLQQWQAFWKSLGAGDVVWAQDSGQAVTAFNVQALGTTIVVDRKGRVVYRDAGATPYETLRRAVLKALE